MSVNLNPDGVVIDPSVGITYRGELVSWSEYTYSWQSEELERLQRLNDARDISSDIENLPGRKPYFYDDWYYSMRPRTQKRGYPWQIASDGSPAFGPLF